MAFVRKIAGASAIGGVVTIAGRAQMQGEYGRSMMPGQVDNYVLVSAITLAAIGCGTWMTTEFLIHRAARQGR